MSQEQNVLRCYACDMYQVHIVKKVKKWQCKICNEKQSIQRVYFRGSGQDCRFTAQKLNISKADELSISTASSIDFQPNHSHGSKDDNELLDIQKEDWTEYSSESDCLDDSRVSETVERSICRNDFKQHTEKNKSTWSKYLQKSNANNDVHNFRDHCPLKNSRFEFGKDFDRNTDDNMWSDILEEAGSDSDVDDIIVSGESQSICNNNSDLQKDMDAGYKTEYTLYNKSNSSQNKQSCTESEIKSNVNTESSSIFETDEGLDDMCLDF